MISDILQNLIYQNTDHFGCNNCKLSYCMNYAKENKICSGVVKQVLVEMPFDVIRLCINTTSEGLQVYDYTPDEILSIVSVLSHSINDWICNTKSYQKFRNGENHEMSG